MRSVSVHTLPQKTRKSLNIQSLFHRKLAKNVVKVINNTYRLQGLDQKPFLVGNVSLEGSLQEALNIVSYLDADLH